MMAARARAVTSSSPFFTARDGSGDVSAGRHEQARVPAGQSAEGRIMPGIIGRRDQSGAARTPRERRRAGCVLSLLLRAAVSSPRDGARRPRAVVASGSKQPRAVAAW